MIVGEHFCAIVSAAEKISGFPLDCVRKNDCNHGTACVLYRKYGSWDNLTDYFIGLAQKTADLEINVLQAVDKKSK